MTAEELLMMSDDVEAYSTDDALVIDAENRIILTPAGGLLLGVESDEEAERIKFVCPRIVGDNIDLSTLQLRAIYRNSNGDKDFRICTDITIDGENIRFSWSLSRKVTRYKGMVNFIICAIRTQSDGSIKNEWNTTLAEGTVLEGLEVDISEEEFEEPKDIVLQLLGMLDEKASDISDAIEAQKAEVISAIQAEEKRVMKTIPEDYTYVYNLAEENKQLKANAIKRTYSGETIVATDSSQAKFEGLRVFGRSEQVSTTGKNLLNNKNTTETINGVTFTVNKDKSVTVNGTATGSNAEFSIVYDANVNGDYILSGCPNGGSLSSYYINVLDTTTWGSPAKDFGSGATLSLIDGRRYHVRILIVKDKTVSNLTFYPMIRIASITDGTYEPYTGGLPSPSPDYPQTIESVGDDGSVDVGVYGKNILKYPYEDTSKTINGINYTDNGDGTITANGTAIENADFAILGNTSIGASFISKVKGAILSGNPSGVSGVFIRASDNIVYSYSDMDGDGVEIETDVRYIYIRVTKGTTVSNVVFKPMLRLSTVSDDTYEPYTKQSLSVSTLNGLPAIKVTDASLATYTDENGVMWCADEVDFARGKYVRRIGELNTRELNWIINNNWTNASETCALAYTMSPTNMRKEEIVSTHFRNFYSFKVGLWQVGQMGVEKNNVLYASIQKELASTRDELQEYMTDLSATVRYVLIEPMETDLTAEQLEAYKALTSNYPTTTILNDENAHMEVTLVADTKNHIEQNYVPLKSYKSLETRVLAVEQALA